MTDDSSVPPALTPEQWTNVCVDGECRADEVYYGIAGWNPTNPDERTIAEEEIRFHRLAALCLYGQPFGFTHEDAIKRELIVVQGGIQSSGTPPSHASLARVNRLMSLASRISALLPPPTP